MKIIQSFWSKPLFEANKDSSQNRYNGGWINYRYGGIRPNDNCQNIGLCRQAIEVYTKKNRCKTLILQRLSTF